jgi:hypothetical protein
MFVSISHMTRKLCYIGVKDISLSYALKRGAPTSKDSTRTTNDLEEHSSLPHQDTNDWT